MADQADGDRTDHAVSGMRRAPDHDHHVLAGAGIADAGRPSYPTTMCRNPPDGAPCAASTRGFHWRSSCTACCRSASSMAMLPLCWWGS